MKNSENYWRPCLPIEQKEKIRKISKEARIGIANLLAGIVETGIKWYYINKQNKESVQEEVTNHYEEVMDSGITENPEELKAILDNLDNLMKGVS